MAVRTAIRRYPDPFALLADVEGPLRQGTLVLPPESFDDEPAPELKVDLVIPLVGRVGPLSAQVMTRLPDGSYAVRVPDRPPELEGAASQVRRLADQARAYLLAAGLVGPPGGVDAAELDRARARVAELERALEVSESARARLLAAAQGEPGRPVAPATEARREGRGIYVPALDAAGATLSGNLADTSIRDAWMKVAVEKSTGIFTWHLAGGRTRWGFWYKGGAVGFRSEPTDEQEVLGVLLFRANQITKEQLAESLRLMRERGIRQGEALVEMGVITFTQLVLLLQKQAEFIFQRVQAERDGTWTFHAMDELPERFLNPPIRVPAMLFRQLRARSKDLPAEELAESLRPKLDRYVYLASGADRIIEEMRLTADEQGFVKIVTQTSYRLRELSAVSNLPRSATASMVWCLDQLRLLDYRTEEAATRVEARVSRLLGSRKTTLEKGTLFDRLDLHWICTARDVEAAWRRLSAEFPPGEYGRFGPEWAATVEAITRGLEEAYQKLRVDAARREYRATVIEKSMIDQSAQMLASKGEMAIMKQNWREAWECYSKAAELMPSVAEYRAGLQQASAQGGGP